MLLELERVKTDEKLFIESPYFGVLAHGYQPPREFNIDVPLFGRKHSASFVVFPEVNGMITDQVYKPILGEVDRLPLGLVTSIYTPLRSYIKKEYPGLFKKIHKAVNNTADREYSVLGDPLVHIILPILPESDQEMMLTAGKKAFIKDFGFAPKGLWLPETAVSKSVLKCAEKIGYEFIPLQDRQVVNVPYGISLDARHNICFTKVDESREIALLLGNTGLSGFVSFQGWSTFNADAFMAGRRDYEQKIGANAVMMMDLERFGHHQIGASAFLNRALNIQESYGFSPLNMKLILEKKRNENNKIYVDVVESSSWSCMHGLGRWTGECTCDNPSPSAIKSKRDFYNSLKKINHYLNESLDEKYTNWRGKFVDLFVKYCDDVFTGENFGPPLKKDILSLGEDESLVRLFIAKIETMVGFTSCGWFFGDDERPEREIPSSMIKAVKDLFPGQF